MRYHFIIRLHILVEFKRLLILQTYDTLFLHVHDVQLVQITIVILNIVCSVVHCVHTSVVIHFAG